MNTQADDTVNVEVSGLGAHETFAIRANHPMGVGAAAAMSFAERHPACRTGNIITGLRIKVLAPS